jgi:hypothetical protein
METKTCARNRQLWDLKSRLNFVVSRRRTEILSCQDLPIGLSVLGSILHRIFLAVCLEK